MFVVVFSLIVLMFNGFVIYKGIEGIKNYEKDSSYFLKATPHLTIAVGVCCVFNTIYSAVHYFLK